MNPDDLRERLELASVPPSGAARELAVTRALSLLREEPRTRRPLARRPVRMLALAALGAAALIAFALLRGSESSGPADSFGDFAALAAEQPAGLQYVRTVSELSYERPGSWAQGKRYPDEIKDATEVRLWADQDIRYEESSHRYWDGRPRTATLRSLLDQRTQLYCTAERGRVTENGCSALYWLTRGADDQPLPTDPETLIETLRDQITSGYRPDRGREDWPDCDPSDGMGGAVPASMVAGADRSTLLTDLRAGAGLKETSYGWSYRPPMTEQLFTRLTGLLADPTSSPELRAAAFQALAQLKGARLLLDSYDGEHRASSVIQFDTPPPEDATRFARDQLFVDPETSQVLEQRTSVIETKGGDHVIGTYSRTFLDRRSVAELPPEADDLSAAMDRAERRCRPGP
jgi:hypothetical protein